MINYKKNRFFTVLIILLSIPFTSSIYAADITLADIANKFNTISYVEQGAEYGYNLNATVDNNTIVIATTFDDEEQEDLSLVYTLVGNTLSSTVEDLTNAIWSVELISCVGQLHGYSKDYMEALLSLEDIADYTVENEGFSITQKGDEYIFDIKINTEQFNLTTDISSMYIEPSDLENIKEYIIGDGSGQMQKGYLTLYKAGSGDVASFSIAEKSSLTEITYKSILSVLEVMFDSTAVVDHFKNSYPSLSQGNANFSSINIEVNPEKTSMETTVFGQDGYEFVRITVIKSNVLSAVNGSTEDPDGTQNQDQIVNIDNTITPITKIPQAGTSSRTSDIITLISLITLSNVIIFIGIFKLKN